MQSRSAFLGFHDWSYGPFFPMSWATYPKIDRQMRTTLPIRVKKLIGTFFIVLLVIIYSLVAVAVASAALATSPWYVHLAYFGFTGVLWIVPAMFIIKWMSTES